MNPHDNQTQSPEDVYKDFVQKLGELQKEADSILSEYRKAVDEYKIKMLTQDLHE